ncbi:hypothetical protein [Kribbella antiqua]|uniref:hypothetical protein n=1 Tax=Kribbella antiqua TaxID=2512217 RepID=UPI00104AF33B|nr:hypothetical protein [Kribbella antiqua]
MIVEIMSETRSAGGDTDEDRPGAETKQPLPVWSVRRAIELLDDAIDRMGEQLARSAGLMSVGSNRSSIDESSSGAKQRSWRANAASSASSEADALLYESSASYEREMP